MEPTKGLADILLLGDERLYQACSPLGREDTELITEIISNLHNALMEFREKYQAGRAIAASQMGYMKSLIYMNIAGKSTVFINPVVTYKSEEMMELWDDCMSLPNLLVRLSRHRTIRIRYYDLEWVEHEQELRDDMAELLQHEYDHLEGILCTMRALDAKAFQWKPTPVPHPVEQMLPQNPGEPEVPGLGVD
ncbi:peptide deformylase [Salmonirosea aquatica]|uniref:Peptide deformylase n=1 Tax=Salmonirosea aquatica TaxID=2654236 RepID=A0A7C9FNE2_9BACT|nr:peptide deformylase [Cytophagaceae bacterium SJW1-29]